MHAVTYKKNAMIMTTFTEGLDFAGKTIHPVTTFAMSGLGSTAGDYSASCPGATVGEGLAVKGPGGTVSAVLSPRCAYRHTRTERTTTFAPCCFAAYWPWPWPAY